MPELKEVRDRVKLDWTAEKQKELKDAAYAKILGSYNVTVERPKTKPASVAVTEYRGAATR